MFGQLRRWARGGLPVWYHPAFRIPIAGLEGRTGIDPRRADHVLVWARDVGIVAASDVYEAPLADWDDLTRVHPPAYLESIDEPAVLSDILGGLDERLIMASSLLEMWRRGVGGTLEAARHVLDAGGRAACLHGGFHHAHPSRGVGFCALNDIAIAIASLRASGALKGRVLIIDVDAHPPDGVAACLEHDDDVQILSLSVEGGFSEVPGILDLRLERGAGDARMLGALDTLLAKVEPARIAFVIAGADPLAGDRFGDLGATEEGLRRRDERILRVLGGTPTVLLPAGGYTNGAWRVFAGTLAAAVGSTAAVRDGYDPMLRRTRDIAATLEPELLSGDNPDRWFDEEDIFMALGENPREERFLGLYSRAGLEYAYTRYGIFQALERMGFRELSFELQTGVFPHRLRVISVVDGRPESLMELSLSIDDVLGFRTLFIEWLQLRDPRFPFTPGRPALPGQENPGLGLADEAGHMLMRMAERLHLDGVSMVPAYYHVAWMARRRFTFVDPVVRGRFVAMKRVLADQKLRTASEWLDGPGLAVDVGEPVKWAPQPMVIPVSAALKTRIAETAEKAEEIAERLLERLHQPVGPAASSVSAE